MNKFWYDTKPAAIELGIAERQLRKLRAEGILKKGQHYRFKNPTAAKPKYLWNIRAIALVLEGDQSAT
ncbi:DNA-binding protein [Pseudanabaena sp. FACHB-1277]|jgi:hypothetical protein|uniref:DNA-binding protein n=1 Tax=Pseudanabaena cinerea FACHB-1277 TaxID=2949581 RepID=A0A926US39_9CYAN|nr:DNA-binding protein [Pseudanabaena cinerea]MBD2150047.1 DNA-binding protein [Pseudanabaena cinerea FACHB-1277]